MKRNSTKILTRMLYVLFLIGTIITFFIVYNGINEDIAFKFLTGYVLFTFFMLVYVPVITIINSRKLKWYVIRKKIFKFLILFALFGALNYVLDFVLRPTKIDLFRELSTALGLSFGISFIDVTMLKNE